MMHKIVLPTPRAVKEAFPLSAQVAQGVAEQRAAHRRLLTRDDPRALFIVGPCSIHDRQAALEYGRELSALAKEVASTSHLIMRVYTEKPRTGRGWKGFLYDPHFSGGGDLETGIEKARELLLELNELGVACATEFVSPLAALYLDDLISWGFIGARTVYSQVHRELASSLPFPIGFKNSLEGSLESCLCAMEVAGEPHTFLYATEEGKVAACRAPGNPHTHMVLRGSLTATNYDAHALRYAFHLLDERALPRRLLIDCAHGNAQRLAENQPDVFYSVLEQMQQEPGILGMMLESHLYGGRQPMPTEYGVSLTDPCLSWERTAELLRAAHSSMTMSSVQS
jgi:3-deoxy-7-phosphoheptulonate synthase